MTTTPLTSIPTVLTAGDSLAVTLTLPDYPASEGWVVKLALAGPDTLEVTATADGDAHALAITDAQSSNLGAGLYQWRVRAALSGTACTVQRGTMLLESDLGSAAPGDQASFHERMLAVLKDAYELLVADPNKEAMIAGRQWTNRDLVELRQEMAFHAREIAKAQNDGQHIPIVTGRWAPAPDGWS